MLRGGDAGTDTDNNAADVATGAPVPHTTGSLDAPDADHGNESALLVTLRGKRTDRR